jgi:hypothetical protein
MRTLEIEQTDAPLILFAFFTKDFSNFKVNKKKSMLL